MITMEPDELYYPVVYDYQQTVILKEDLPIFITISGIQIQLGL